MSTKRLFTGSVFRFTSLAISIVVAFFMMPFLVGHLGDHNYGLWILIASTLSFYGFLNSGLSSATQRFFAYALSKKDTHRLNEILSNSLFLFAIVALLAVLITIILTLSADSLFDSKSDAESFTTIVSIMGTALAISFVMNVYNAVLTSYYRFDIQAKIDLFKDIFRAITVFAVFSISPSILNLALITVLFDMIGHWLILRATFKQANWIAPSLTLVNRKEMGSLISFGWYGLLMFISQQLRERGPHFVIAGSISIANVTLYQIASQLIFYYNRIQSSLLGILTPYFTQLFGKKKIDELQNAYLFTLKLATLSSSLLSGGLVIFGEPFIQLWMGEGYTQAYDILVPLAIGTFFLTMHFPTFQLLVAVAGHKKYAVFQLCEALVIIGLCIYIAPRHGIISVAIVSGIIMSLNRLFVFPFLISNATGIKATRIMATSFYSAIACILIQTGIWQIIEFTFPVKHFISMLPSGIVIYILAVPITLLAILNKQERALVITALKTWFVRSKN